MGVFEDARHNVPKDVGVPLQELKSRFARLLTDPGAQQDHAATNEVLILSVTNFERLRERHGMAKVVGFRRGASRVLVDKDDFATDALHHHGKTGRGAHESAADDADFHVSSNPGDRVAGSERKNTLKSWNSYEERSETETRRKTSGEGGIRTTSKTPANSALFDERAAKCAALAGADPELLQVVQSWPNLSDPIKLAILALVRSRLA